MTLLYSQIKEETLHACALLSKSITRTLCSTSGNYKFAASPSMFFFSSLSKKTTPSLKELKDMSMTAPCSQTNKILLYVCLFSSLSKHSFYLKSLQSLSMAVLCSQIKQCLRDVCAFSQNCSTSTLFHFWKLQNNDELTHFSLLSQILQFLS